MARTSRRAKANRFMRGKTIATPGGFLVVRCQAPWEICVDGTTSQKDFGLNGTRID
jgi:hypothetical protein